jgi:two-component system cell cycle response regulator
MTLRSVILSIDDEPIIREAIDGLLQSDDYQLEFAANGPEGLAKAAALLPDLILLDIMMPGMDGFEVCRRLRADAILAEVPVVMVTALGDPDSRLRGIAAGADDFISKPFNRAELCARVHTITRLNRYRRLLSERNRFQWIVDEAEEGYLLLDGEGFIHYANTQAQLDLGLPRKAAGVDFLHVVQAQYQLEPASAWELWTAPNAADQTLYLLRPETPHSRAFWLEARAFDSPDHSGMRTVRLRDITQRINTTFEIRRFQTAISHKLRTPLGQMHASLELLALTAPDTSREEIAEMAGIAYAAAGLLTEEITEILDYLQAPLVAVSEGGLTLTQIVDRMVRAAQERGIAAVEFWLPEELALSTVALSTVALSIHAVDLIAWELVENARKFHPTHTPAIWIGIQPTGDGRVTLIVADNGITLAPDQLKAVWTPYVQAEKFTTGASPGMGLGLALVASIVWQVGGEVRMTNREPGPGIAVQLTLPCAPSIG